MSEKICKCISFNEFSSLESNSLKEDLTGIVINEEQAISTPCTKIKDKNLVFSKGIVGVLSKDQKDKYCSKIIEVERKRSKESDQVDENYIKPIDKRISYI